MSVMAGLSQCGWMVCARRKVCSSPLDTALDSFGSSSNNAAEVQHTFFPSFNGEHNDDEEEEIDGYSADLLKRAEEVERATAIFRAQVPHRNRIWMSSMVK
ncbi:hypothetical protein B0H14DRAFT_2578303 [Mycena olivaceomarginata]|nr:hypothetical protein B0H14DRAFT_2578303 [Mycena olivaceomarginata]